MKQRHYAKEAYQCCGCGTRVHADLKRWPRCRLGCGGHQDVNGRQVNVLCLPLQAAVRWRKRVICPSSASVLVAGALPAGLASAAGMSSCGALAWRRKRRSFVCRGRDAEHRWRRGRQKEQRWPRNVNLQRWVGLSIARLKTSLGSCPLAEHWILTLWPGGRRLKQFGLLDLITRIKSEGTGWPVYPFLDGHRDVLVCSFISSLDYFLFHGDIFDTKNRQMVGHK
jgi:hypothetical protein